MICQPFSRMVQESKFRHCSLIASFVSKVLFQTSVYTSVRGETAKTEGDVNTKYIHIFFPVISSVLQKVLIKTEGCFQFLVYLLHSVPSQG